MQLITYVLKSKEDFNSVKDFSEKKVQGAVVNVLTKSGSTQVWLTHANSSGVLLAQPPRPMPIACCYPAKTGLRNVIGDWSEQTAVMVHTILKRRVLFLYPYSQSGKMGILDGEALHHAQERGFRYLAEGGRD